VNCIATQSAHGISARFNTEGIVPQNWYVSNGSTTRVGGGLPNTNGPRLLHFTNATKAFEYGLLIQNATGKEKDAWARFGDPTGRSGLTLHTGHYAIKYKICNWNQSNFTPVTVAIEDRNGQVVASQTYTPTVNIGGKAGNKFTGVQQQTFEFDITETGDYVVVFYTDAAKNADFVLGQASIHAMTFETGIHDITPDKAVTASHTYDLNGRRVENGKQKRGIYIIDGHKAVVR
jgi:hypothetical protein